MSYIALPMPTNAVSIAVLNTSQMPRLVCPFQVRSICSSSKNLNLGCWEARIPWTKHIDWESFLKTSNDSYELIHPDEKSYSLSDVTVSIHGTTSIRMRRVLPWIAGDLKSVLEPFQRLRGSSQCVLSSDFSSLAYWNLHWTVLKPYILPQRYKRLISDIQRIELFPLLNAQREGLRWSALRLYSTLGFNIAAILRIWLFTRSVRFSRTPRTTSGGGII